MGERNPLGFWQIWNMSFGFLGIQFGWGLQMANMSAIYEYLGADPHQIPMLWLAAPLTGLIIQPIIGHMSDRTWCALGRRRPYFLVGALLSSLALALMPNSSSLWMAAGLLWILDASINVSMEPFRAFVADLLPDRQRTRGFAMQSLFIGLGAVIASALPWLLREVFHVSGEVGGAGAVPLTVKLSFYVGAAAFITAVLWTVLSTKEHPPAVEQHATGQDAPSDHSTGMVREIFSAIRQMPPTMRRLAPVQFFTWMGLFCMWIYFSVAVASNVFGAQKGTPLYTRGIEWAGVCFAVQNGVCFVFSLFLPMIAAKLGRRATHQLCLSAGAAGLISVAFISDPNLLLLSMAGVGIAWASILAMPYAILAGSLPANRTGVYMGIFNFFIVLPEIIAAVGLGWIMQHLFGNDRLVALIAGGVFMLIAAGLMALVQAQPTAASLPVANQGKTGAVAEPL